MGFFDLVDAGVDFVEIGVFTAGAVGGVGKHGDFGLVASEIMIGGGSVFDNSVELLLCGGFVDTAVGESEYLIVFLANKTAGEKGGF